MGKEQIAPNPGDTILSFETIIEKVKYLAESGDCNPLSILHALALSVVSLVGSAEHEKELALAFYMAVLNDEINRVELNTETYNRFNEILSSRKHGDLKTVSLALEISAESWNMRKN